MRNALVGCGTGPLEQGFCLSWQISRIGSRPERRYSLRISAIYGNMSIWDGGWICWTSGVCIQIGSVA